MMLKQPEGGIREFTGDGRQLRGPAEANNRLLREDRYEVTAKLAYEHWEKEAARWARLMLIGMRLKPRCVSTWWLQALRSVPTGVSTAKQDDQDKAPCESPARLLSRSAVPARNGKLFSLLAALAFVTLCPRTIPLEVN